MLLPVFYNLNLNNVHSIQLFTDSHINVLSLNHKLSDVTKNLTLVVAEQEL